MGHQELIEAAGSEGSVITLDAIGCQTEIAREIRQQIADCMLVVTGNQTTLLDDLARTFASVGGPIILT